MLDYDIHHVQIIGIHVECIFFINNMQASAILLPWGQLVVSALC